MSQINKVLEIISKLTPEEKVTVRTYLSVFVERGKANTSKGLKLYDLLSSLKDKEVDADQIHQQIYRTPNPTAFNRLVFRLRDKILMALIIDVNTDREGAYPEATRVNIDVRHQITQAQILLNRGARKLAETMFEKVILQCKKYELYEELLLALKFLIRQRNLDEGNKKLKDLLKLYEKFDQCKSAVLRAEVNYHKVIAATDFHSRQNVKLGWLRNILDEMSDDYKKTRSSQIGYYYYYVEAQFYQVQRNYKSARKALLNVSKLIEGNSVMNIPAVIGGVLLNLADNDLYMGEFERCFETADHASQLFNKESFNYKQAVELMYYSKFYAGEFSVATNIGFQMIPETVSHTDFRKGKRNYLLACSYFMLEDFTTALRYLNLLNPIETDKHGWNIGIRILRIMTLVELKEFDEAGPLIENLRRLLNNDSTNSHRAKLISQVLQTLSYAGYNFKSTHQKEKGIVEMLESNAGALAWEIKSAEMVIFNQWLFARATHQKFSQKIPSFHINQPKEAITEE